MVAYSIPSDKFTTNYPIISVPPQKKIEKIYTLQMFYKNGGVGEVGVGGTH